MIAPVSTSKLSNRSIARISGVFASGGGPSHSDIDRAFLSGGGERHLVAAGGSNKADRVLRGLLALRDGLPEHQPPLAPDATALVDVAEALSAQIFSSLQDDPARVALRQALAADGYAADSTGFAESRVASAPADRLADDLQALLGGDPALGVAEGHYAQAVRAFERGDYEAANAQYRTTLEAVYNVLAARKGCPDSKRGGDARKWLTEQGHLQEDEDRLLRAAAVFAGRAGSHPGVSDVADSQLRRHVVTAVIVFGLAKLA